MIRMRILQIIPDLGMGGAETMCETLTYELINLGHEVFVVSLYEKETPISMRMKNNGVKLIFLGKKQGFDFLSVTRLSKIIKTLNPNVLHTHLYALKYTILASLFKRIPIIHTVHNVAVKEAGKKDRKFNGHFFHSGKVTPVALSNEIQKTIVDEYSLNSKRVPIILNGINLDRCKTKINYDFNSTFKIVNVARFFPQKNHKRLIDAFCLFREKFKNVELHLIGDGELRNDVEKYVVDKGLYENVKFLGVQNDVYDFLNNSDCFALTSDYEGVPITIIEAMGTGLPIISTNVGGLSDMLQNHVSGILVGLDANEIFDAFVDVYTQKTLRQNLGSKAREESFRFSSKTMANSYLDLYKVKVNEN